MSDKQAQISVLRFPDNVRKRKEMYLPNKDHAVFEIVDNSVDEALAGYATAIAIAIIEDEITVEDNGRGMPVTPHKDPEFKGLSQAEVAYTVLHAGGKFGGSTGYKTKTGGLHGVGASVVNALCENLTLSVRTGGEKHQVDFEKGIITQKLRVVEKGLKSNDTGTDVKFKLDAELWEDERFDLKRIKRRIQQLAYLNPGLSLYLCLDADDKDDKRLKEENVFCYPDGLNAYLELLTKGKTKLTKIVGITQTRDEVDISISMAYTDAYSEDSRSFCNNISTEDGGDHLTGFRMGLTKMVNDYAIQNKFIKEDAKFEAEDIREGLVAIISIKVDNPKFQGQAKSKLDMPKIRSTIKKVCEEFVHDYLDKNPEDAKLIIAKSTSAMAARNAAKKARENVRKQKDLIEGGLPGKLSDCQSKEPFESEVFIVEGEQYRLDISFPLNQVGYYDF